MIIKDIFSKPIDRDLKGVIKVGQAEDENIKQELEEYVVTKELQKHFATFFSNYKRGINGRTDKMGVWISGFFGSGKSHFLKIISYILENKTVDGVPAIEYFERDKKIADSMVLADMKLAANTPSTVILFNIDSKSESTGKKDKEAILSVFLKVFNEKLGFCGAYPHVADLERKLTDEGKYEQFKSKFEEISGDSWLEERTAIDFIQDELVETLVAIGFMSEEAAQRWCDKATEPYSLSIERFAELIKKYIDSKGRNHHIIFLVDEIGQYVGDDTDLMLNLQTVTEDLGTACGGKAWVIVTSQQDIDSITKVKGRDFSKIQGRFDTRLSLSSADVAEVIRKRILDKNETGKTSLSVLYDDKATVIKNLILFNDDAEKKLYSGRDDFAITYPFVPYQFNLLGSVLTAVRTYGASGKHLADGERSMLALFKESAMRLENKELGAIVPFYMFYGALEEFIDHSHRGVITKALDNEKLNPEHEADCFDVNVLKALFMIKYVKEIKATVENITSLMVSDINEDRIELKQKVEVALKRLIKQTLVQKSAGETYVFLTNEEQEINRAVENQNIEQGEITQKVSELIFEGLYSENKFRAPELKGRYTYGFNRFVDSRPHKTNQNFALTLKVLTPNSDETHDETTLRMLSGQNTSVLVVLPDDTAFLDEIAMSIKINKFLTSEASKAATKYEQIKADKRVELREHNEQSRIFLEEALKAADIYVNGDKIQPSAKDVSTRINEALGKLAAAVYNKLGYIDTPTSDSDIKAIFRDKGQQLSICVNWNRELKAAGGVTNLPKQIHFYDNYIRSAKERTVVIISDALRYEVGYSLFRKLKADEKCKVKIEPMQSVVPSYTRLGMAALLPHRKLEMTDDFEVLVDGKGCNDTAHREPILQSYKPNSRAVQYDDLKNMSVAQLREVFTNQEVVYVYHNQVDARGDKPNTENEVFTACEEAIEEIAALIRRLTISANTVHFIVTADHGFIYKRDKLTESDKIGNVTGSKVYKAKRYIVAKDAVVTEGVESLPLSTVLNNDDDKVVSFPMASDIFKAAGGGMNFVHGGSSPQEMLIPLIDVRTEKGHKETTSAVISLVSLSNKITNLIFSLDFIQNEPVGSVVKEATYRICFVNENGEKISNEILHTADNKSTEAANRIFKLRFNLRNRQYSRSDKYYLLIVDDKKDLEVLRHEVMIDIAFADDFGF